MDKIGSQTLRDPPAAPAVAHVPDGTLADRVRSLRLPDEISQGSSRRFRTGWIVLAILLLVAIVSVAVVAMRKNQEKSDQASPAGAASSTGNSSAVPIAPTGDVVLESKGYIIPVHQILVSPKINGMVVELNIEEGRKVKKGDVLAVLESTDYAADLARAKALLAAAKERLTELENGFRPKEIAQAAAELEEAKAQRQQMESEWKRQQELRKSSASTEREYQKAESEFTAMDRRAERLKFVHALMVEGPRKEKKAAAAAEVAQYEAEVAKAQWRFDNCTVRAPVSGTILKKNAEYGSIVNPVAMNGAFSLCDMADLSDLEVDLSIQERDVSRVKAGQKCNVRADAFPERVYNGFVSRLMPIADRAKGAVPVRVKLTVPAAEEGVYLKPEMGAVVSFLKSGK